MFLTLRTRSFRIAMGLCLAIVATAATSASLINNRTTSMRTMETTEFNWGLSTNHYYVDRGNTPMMTHEGECWMEDAQGNLVMQWLGAGSAWGGGSGPMGGDAKWAPLPKKMRLTYYDYLEDKFYQLDAELPIARLYDLFQLKAIDLDWGKGEITPKYQDFVIGVAPRGYVVLWLRGDNASEQIEIETYKAHVMGGYTAERYNREVQPGFPVQTGEERWEYLSDKTKLKPETVAKLKAGWRPDNLYYKKQRTKYPWRFAMTGNARLLEFRERYGNQEGTYVHPWQMTTYQNIGQMRGIPQNAHFIFNDLKGNRYELAFKLFDQYRVAGEPDLSGVWAAFEKLFPGRIPEDNAYLPGDKDMATVEVHASDDLKTFTATLVKGDQRIPLPGRGTQILPLKPWSNNYGSETPPPEVIKRQQYGPDTP